VNEATENTCKALTYGRAAQSIIDHKEEVIEEMDEDLHIWLVITDFILLMPHLPKAPLKQG
jgi:hypothetical protein